MPYAIARVAKVKSLGSLRGLGAHHMRTAPTPNADPLATPSNRVLVGTGNPYADVKALLPEKVRKNAVLAMEHLLTASPEYFRPHAPDKAGTYDPERMESWAASALEFLRDRYGDSLASAVLHLDEATPHIQALVLPLREDGKLDAAKLFGPEQLRDLQDCYADKLAPLGLQRGIEGSKAKHESIKAFYGRVKAPAPELPKVSTPPPEPMPERTLKEMMPFTEEKARYDAETARREAQGEQRRGELAKRRKAVEKALPGLVAKAAVVDSRAKAEKSREKVLSDMKAEAARVREIPLDAVLERLGCERDPADPKSNWKTPVGRITVTGSKFFNHDQGEGGGGAIDLAKELLACDYKAAVAWLGAEISPDAAIGAAMAAAKAKAKAAVETTAPPSPIPTPSRDAEHVQRVRRYLVEVRKISAQIVDWALEKGKVFAAVWPTRGGKTLVNVAFKLGTDGVELRGTASNFHGVRGKKGAFVISAKNPTKAVFVESAIEAMSYHQLNEGREAARVISTTGSSKERLLALVAEELAAGRKVVPAFNNDAPGRKLAAVVEKAGGERHEVPPLGCNDWNELVQLRADPEKLRERMAAQEPPKRERSRIRDSGPSLG